MWESYDVVQFYHKPLLNLPKNLGKRSQTAKNTKNDHFSYVWALLSADSNHKEN